MDWLIFHLHKEKRAKAKVRVLQADSIILFTQNTKQHTTF
jgi:hypothetical protein